MLKKMVASFLIVAIMICVLDSNSLIVYADMCYEVKTTELLKEVLANSTNEKVAVCVWYNDIDHSLVETEIETTTGLTKEKLNTDLDMPSNDILSKLGKLDKEQSSIDTESLESDMEKYMFSTTTQREAERRLVEIYADTKRSIKSEQISQKCEELVKNLDVQDYEILFRSKYSPFIIIECKSDRIKEIALISQVKEIDYHCTDFGKVVPPSTGSVRVSSGMAIVYSWSGLTGDGLYD